MYNSKNSDEITVLHVDDDPDLAKRVASFVEREDDRFDVETVRSVEEGLAQLADGDYQCVVSEYELPGQNGIEFLETVRESYPDLPFILYTGEGNGDVASEAISRGATDYLEKDTRTVQFELLGNRIDNAVSHYQGQQAERQLRELAEDTREIVWIYNHNWTELQFVNAAYEEIWGLSVDRLRDDPTDFLNGIHPDDRDRVRNAMQHMSGGSTVQLEYRVNPTEDYGRWVNVRGEPIVDETGETVRVAGFATDITERKRQEEELERSRDLLRHVERLTDIGGWEAETATGEQRWTAGTYAIHDVSAGAFDPTVEEGIEFYHPDDRETIENAVSRCRETGEPYEVECRLITAKDRVRWVRANGEAVTEDGSIVALRGAIQDITERKDRELDLQLFKRAVDNAGQAVFITDRDGTITYVNPMFEANTGYTREEALGRKPSILKSGKQNTAFYERMWETLLSGDRWDTNLVNKRKNGELYHVEQTISPITDDAGEITHFVAIESDVTNRQLRKQQLDVLNRVLRHNLRNDTNVIQGYATQLRELTDDEELHAKITPIETHAEKLVQLADKAETVRSLFREELPAESTLEVAPFLSGLVEEFSESHPSASVSLRDIEAVSIHADRRLELAVTELLDNAIKHADYPPPTVRVSAGPAEERGAKDWVKIQIMDNGPGIPKHERATIERGEETSLRHGSGLGLWIVYWTVFFFGGEVNIIDTPPHGACVELLIPRTPDDVSA